MSTHRILKLAALLLIGLALAGCISFNRPPIALFSRTPSAGDAPLAVFFDATDSLDPDGEVFAYMWGFGDGAADSGPTVTHTYQEAGTYEATLTVVDDDGAESTFVKAITVTSPAQEPPEVGAAVGQQAPQFTLRELDGEDVSLSDFRGLVVLIDFWRSTCPPCRTTMPHLEALREEFEGEGLVLVGVNLDVTEAAARNYVVDNGFDEMITLRGSLEDAEAVRALYGVGGIPHTFVIDRQGIVRHADHPIRLRDYHIEPWL